MIERLQADLAALPNGDFTAKAENLLKTLGYDSERKAANQSGTVDDFILQFPATKAQTVSEHAFGDNIKAVHIIFQITDEEIAANTPTQLRPSDTQSSSTQSFSTQSSFNEGDNRSFIFAAVELNGNSYPRGQYAQFTREINRRLTMPTVVLFKTTDGHLTLAFIHRRRHKRDGSRDVLGSVSLLREIDCQHPHIKILAELALEKRLQWMNDHSKPHNFDSLLAAWLNTLDTEALNRRFYQKLFAWFKRAVSEATFPSKASQQRQIIQPEEHIIRLITRLLFIWFIKEKNLVAEELFIEEKIGPLLQNYDSNTGNSYYRAVLQNLFFATLNTEIKRRGFSERKNVTHRDFSRYRYKKEIGNPDALLGLFAQTPFINGGLFDCLDSEAATGDGGYRIDCFSDNEKHSKLLSLPNRLFFDNEGLIPLFKSYKFTVEENTPAEQEGLTEK